jgi:CubicO group peptidase (beta-lactamase class C family)
MPPPRRWPKFLLLLPALPFLALAAFWLFSLATSQLIHPDPQAIPAQSSVASPQAENSSIEDARAILRAAIASENLPALSIAVAKGQVIVWAEAFGWADIATNKAATPQTRFRLGTASALLTAAGAGLLLEQGKLPGNKLPNLQAANAITAAPPINQRCEKASDALRLNLSLPPWTLASAAIESAAYQPFSTYMQQRLFTPLSLTHTGAESSVEENPDRIGEEGEDPPLFNLARHLIFQPLGLADPIAKPTAAPATIYEPGIGHNALPRYNVHEIPIRNLSCYSGALAFYSTPSDLVRLASAITHGSFLQHTTVEALHIQRTLNNGLAGELQGQQLAAIVANPQSGITVAIATNANAGTSDLAHQIANAFSKK